MSQNNRKKIKRLVRVAFVTLEILFILTSISLFISVEVYESEMGEKIVRQIQFCLGHKELCDSRNIYRKLIDLNKHVMQHYRHNYLKNKDELLFLQSLKNLSADIALKYRYFITSFYSGNWKSPRAIYKFQIFPRLPLDKKIKPNKQNIERFIAKVAKREMRKGREIKYKFVFGEDKREFWKHSRKINSKGMSKKVFKNIIVGEVYTIHLEVYYY